MKKIKLTIQIIKNHDKNKKINEIKKTNVNIHKSETGHQGIFPATDRRGLQVRYYTESAGTSVNKQIN